MFISRMSKEIPSPAAKSDKPPKSARLKSFTIPGAFITLKFSIFSFELDNSSSNIDV